MRYAICDFNGMIIGEGEFPELADAEASCSGFGWVHPLVPGENVTPGAQYIQGGAVLDLPPKPAPHLVYDRAQGAWVDPRSAADWAAALSTRRAVASMARLDFVLACTERGILSQDDALIAVDGGFPAAFQDIVAALPSDAQFEARLRWKGAVAVDRLGSLIIGLADEWQLDQIFGLAWPPPLASWPDGQLHP